MAKQKSDSPVATEPKLTASVDSILRKDEDDNNLPVKTGRKPADINWDRVETCMAMGGDLKMCAMFGGVHWNTLERRILERYGENFREVRAAFMTDRKAMALKALWNQVAKGNTRAIIFVNRAINGLNDRPKEMDEDNDDGGTFKLAYNLDEPPPIEADFHEVSDE